jgi:hypothetical protein
LIEQIGTEEQLATAIEFVRFGLVPAFLELFSVIPLPGQCHVGP